MSTPLVTATLLASVSQVAPGQQLWLGIRYDLSPGWHIYWHNPGDSGMSTSVELSGEGVELGLLQWPAPQAIPAAGGLTNFGYHGSATLLLPATVAADAAGELALQGETRWLVCKEDVCTPGSAELSLRLPVGVAGTGDSLADARAALPQPLPENVGLETLADGLVIHTGADDPVAFFPDRRLESVLGAVEVSLETAGTRIRLQLTGPLPPGSSAVYTVDSAVGRRAYRVPLSPSTPASESP